MRRLETVGREKRAEITSSMGIVGGEVDCQEGLLKLRATDRD